MFDPVQPPAPLSEAAALILVGGVGTRLRPVVADRPKALAIVRGRPFLVYLLDHVVEAGIGRIVLCTGFGGDAIQREFGFTYRGVELTYSQENRPLGTAGALRNGLHYTPHGPILVMNGDSFCDVSLEDFWQWCDDRSACAAQVLTCVPDIARFGEVLTLPSGEVTQFREKNSAGGSGWVNAGIYRFSREVLQNIPPDREVSLEREVLPQLVGHGLFGYKSAARFLDIGTPDSYREAPQFFSVP